MTPIPSTAESSAVASLSTTHEILAIATGGALGATLRYAVALGINAVGQHTVWATAIANLLGSFLLGVILARVDSRAAHPILRPFLVVGVFGSFTTFSALAFDSRLLASQFGEAAGVLHMAASIASGLVAFAVGSALAWRHE